MRLTRLRERAFHTDSGGILLSTCYNDAIRDDGQWSPSDSCEPRFTTAIPDCRGIDDSVFGFGALLNFPTIPNDN